LAFETFLLKQDPLEGSIQRLPCTVHTQIQRQQRYIFIYIPPCTHSRLQDEPTPADRPCLTPPG
jgi:hypothetical protein